MPAFQPDVNNVSWRVSKRCDGGACIAVGRQEGAILVGNTAQSTGLYISYTADAWKEFVLKIKQGHFDRPA